MLSEDMLQFRKSFSIYVDFITGSFRLRKTFSYILHLMILRFCLDVTVVKLTVNWWQMGTPGLTMEKHMVRQFDLDGFAFWSHKMLVTLVLFTWTQFLGPKF